MMLTSRLELVDLEIEICIRYVFSNFNFMKIKLQRGLKKSVGPTIVTGNALCRSIEQLLEKKTNRNVSERQDRVASQEGR
jgi:hypothetical protein